MPNPTTGEPIPLKRSYLSSREDSAIRLDEGPKDHERMQAFGFVLAGESRLSRDKLMAVVFLREAGAREVHGVTLCHTEG